MEVDQKGKRGKDMKSFKKALAASLALAMVVTAVPVTPAEAATTAKLSAKSVTVAHGPAKDQTKSIKVTTPSAWKRVKVAVSSSDKKVATVKVSGKTVKVTAVKKGTAKVTVKVTAKKSGKAVKKTLTATAKVINGGLKFTETPSTVVLGSTLQLKTKTCPTAATVTYTSSDVSVATVDAKGVVTPVKTGKTTILAKNNYGSTAMLTLDVVDANTVKSAEVLNAKQIKVTFNTEVAEDEAKNAANYTLAGAGSASVEKVSDTEYVLTFGSNIADDVERAFTVKAIATKADSSKKTAEYSAKIKAKDTTKPTIVSVSAITNGDKAGVTKVTFSEPVVSGVYSIDGEAITPAKTTATGAEFNKELDASKAHTLQVIGLKDYAGNETELQSVPFNVTVDKTQPTVAITAEGEDTIKLTFSKDVKPIPVGAVTVKNAATGIVVATPSTFEGSGKEYTTKITPAFGSGTTVSYIVEVADTVTDELGNKLVKASQTISFTKDATAPALQSISVNKTDDGKLIKEIVITASEKVQNGTGDFVVVNKNGEIKTSDFAGTATIKDNTITIALTTPAAFSDKYTFNFPTGYVLDLSLAKNKSNAASIVYDFGGSAPAASAELKAEVKTAGKNAFTVTYSDTVTTASAENKANYALNGSPLPANTSVVLRPDLKTVDIKLQDGTIATTNTAAYLVVSGVVSYKGVTVTATTKNVVVTDNTAPTLVSATKTATGVVLKFSEKISKDSVKASCFSYLGKVFDGKVVELGADSDTITLTDTTLEVGKKIGVNAYTDKVTDSTGNVGATGEVAIQ